MSVLLRRVLMRPRTSSHVVVYGVEELSQIRIEYEDSPLGEMLLDKTHRVVRALTLTISEDGWRKTSIDGRVKMRIQRTLHDTVANRCDRNRPHIRRSRLRDFPFQERIKGIAT